MMFQLGRYRYWAVMLLLSGLFYAGCKSGHMDRQEKEILYGSEPHRKMKVLQNDRPDEERMLRRKAKRVRYDDPLLWLAIARLRITMTTDRSIGIAAPQVGLGRRIILVTYPIYPKAKVVTTVYLNPEIVGRSPTTISDWEGCMSIPTGYAKVLRPSWIRMRYMDLRGKEREVRAEGLHARIILHETDHLDGVLFIDKKEPGPMVSREEYDKKYWRPNRGAPTTEKNKARPAVPSVRPVERRSK